MKLDTQPLVFSFWRKVHLNKARIEAIRNQADKFELNIQFLEPHSFEGLAAEAVAWRKFLEDQVGPSE